MNQQFTGTFVQKDGSVQQYHRAPIEVLQDNGRFHLRLEGSGRGTIAVTGRSGSGRYTTLGGHTFDIDVSIDGPRWLCRLRRGDVQIAEGVIFFPAP